MEWSSILSLFGNISIGMVMVILARLSQRLGYVTHARQHFIWLYVAAALVWLGTGFQAFMLGRGINGQLQLHQDIGWVLLIKGLPALGVMVGLVVVWYYWSWLLAERD